MADFLLEQLDEDDEPDELSVCRHGVGFDEVCEVCDVEIEAEFEDDDEEEK